MKIVRFLIVVLVILLIGGGIFYFFNKNKHQDSSTSKNFKLYDEQVAIIEEAVLSNKQIKTTNGVTHNVDLEELKTLGASQDETPPIDSPKFVSINEAEKTLSDDEPGIVLSSGKVNRFYPYRILTWHEIVNDRLENQRVLVTYSPLTLTAAIFDPNVDGERVEFGNSGKLWRAGLVMYDKKTNSNWSQIIGEAIVGSQTGKRLPMIPSDQVSFGVWKKEFPNGQVLSEETGNERFYGESPYGDYFKIPDVAADLVDFKDSRLANDALVLGIAINGQSKAYSIDKIKQLGNFEDEFMGRKVILENEEKLGTVRMYEVVGNTKIRISPVFAPWAIWAATYPNTDLFK